MHRTLLLLSLVLAAPGAAFAQAGAPGPASSAPVANGAPARPTQPALAQPDSLQQFLERRVVEELAAEGLLLGRLGYAVKISVTGNSAEVALWDTTSSRIVRATKVDGLVMDREAALATLTQVVANMVAQQSQVTSEPVPVAPGASPGRLSPPEGRFGREEAEARFRREAIGWGNQVVPGLGPGGLTFLEIDWWAWRGERRAPMSRDEFCAAISQPERCRRWRERQSSSRRLQLGGKVAVMVVAPALLAWGTYDLVEDRSRAGYVLVGAAGVAVIAGGIASIVGGQRQFTPMISDWEAKVEAEKYNDNLRRKYGLPVAATARSLAPSFRVAGATPYVGENRAGLALVGRF